MSREPDHELPDDGRHSGGNSHGGHPPHGGGSHAEGEHEGAPEWLISFADNVMLMMGLFVIMLAMNMAKVTTGGIGGEDEMGGAPTTHMADFLLSVRQAFNNPVLITSTNPHDQALVRRLKERANQGQAPEPGIDGKNNTLQGVQDSDYKSLAATLSFQQLSSVISDDTAQSIADTAARIKGYNNIVNVRGHVSANESRNDQSGGYDLSYRRALAVAAQLAAYGVPWTQLRVVACSDSERHAGGYDDPVSIDNDRRVEVIVTDRIADDH